MRLFFLLRTKPLGAAGAIVLLLVVLVAIFAPLLAPADPLRTDIPSRLAPPSSPHLLGTDEMGRDVLSRIVYGSRISLLVGLLATFLGTSAGAIIGVASAFWGRKIDLVIQGAMDLLMSFPTLILAMGIMAVLGASLTNVIIAISIAFVARSNRAVRSAALSIKETTYVEAARAIGCRTWRILTRAILLNCIAPYIVIVSALLGQAIVIEASLSFLGIGIPPPTPSWGRSLSEAMPFIRGAPWLSIVPGAMLSLTVFGFNLFGDALRDTLDPRLRQR